MEEFTQNSIKNILRETHEEIVGGSPLEIPEETLEEIYGEIHDGISEIINKAVLCGTIEGIAGECIFEGITG